MTTEQKILLDLFLASLPNDSVVYTVTLARILWDRTLHTLDYIEFMKEHKEFKKVDVWYCPECDDEADVDYKGCCRVCGAPVEHAVSDHKWVKVT